LSNTTTLVVRHPPRKAATTGSTPSSMYKTSLEPVLPAVVPLVEPAWWRESRVGQCRRPVDIRRRRRDRRSREKTERRRAAHTRHTHTHSHTELGIRRWATAAHTRKTTRARTHTLTRGRALDESKKMPMRSLARSIRHKKQYYLHHSCTHNNIRVRVVYYYNIIYDDVYNT